MYIGIYILNKLFMHLPMLQKISKTLFYDMNNKTIEKFIWLDIQIIQNIKLLTHFKIKNSCLNLKIVKYYVKSIFLVNVSNDVFFYIFDCNSKSNNVISLIKNYEYWLDNSIEVNKNYIRRVK